VRLAKKRGGGEVILKGRLHGNAASFYIGSTSLCLMLFKEFRS